MALQSRGFSLSTLPTAPVLNYNPRPLDFSALERGIENLAQSYRERSNDRMLGLASQYAATNDPEEQQSILDQAGGNKSFMDSIFGGEVNPSIIKGMGDKMRQEAALEALQAEMMRLNVGELTNKRNTFDADQLADFLERKEVPAGMDIEDYLGLTPAQMKLLPQAEGIIRKRQEGNKQKLVESQLGELTLTNAQQEALLIEATQAALAGEDLSIYPEGIQAAAGLAARKQVIEMESSERRNSDSFEQIIDHNGNPTELFKLPGSGQVFLRDEAGQFQPFPPPKPTDLSQMSMEAIIKTGARLGIYTQDHLNEDRTINMSSFLEAFNKAQENDSSSWEQKLQEIFNPGGNKLTTPATNLVTPSLGVKKVTPKIERVEF